MSPMKETRKDTLKMDRNYKIAFGMIRMVHDGWLIRRLIDPAEYLAALGMSSGDAVLEIGCGPGFYTVGAAKVVGPEGMVHAYEVNPYAVRYVREKIERLSLTNVAIEERNANRTGLPDNSIDFGFLFGVPRIAGGRDPLLEETARILRPGGTMAFKPERNKTEAVKQAILEHGFSFEKIERRCWIFVRG